MTAVLPEAGIVDRLAVEVIAVEAAVEAVTKP
jgi:hypothetical protein